MAVVEVFLPIGGAMPPDNSASNLAPALQRVKSTNASNPKAVFLQAAFDATNDEYLFWRFKVPNLWNGSTAPVVKFPFKMTSATTNNIIGQAAVQCITPGDATDVDADGFDSFNASSATAVAGTAGHEKEVSITLTNRDSMAAGDNCILVFGRQASSGSDTATGDMEVAGGITVEFTTA